MAYNAIIMRTIINEQGITTIPGTTGLEVQGDLTVQGTSIYKILQQQPSSQQQSSPSTLLLMLESKVSSLLRENETLLRQVLELTRKVEELDFKVSSIKEWSVEDIAETFKRELADSASSEKRKGGRPPKVATSSSVP